MLKKFEEDTGSGRFKNVQLICPSCLDFFKGGKLVEFTPIPTEQEHKPAALPSLAICNRSFCIDRIIEMSECRENKAEVVGKIKTPCKVCRKESEVARVCEHCNWAFYCSEECQEKDSRFHASACISVAIKIKAKRIHRHISKKPLQEKPRVFVFSYNSFVSNSDNEEPRRCTFCLSSDVAYKHKVFVDEIGKDSVELHSCDKRRCVISNKLLGDHLEFLWDLTL